MKPARLAWTLLVHSLRGPNFCGFRAEPGGQAMNGSEGMVELWLNGWALGGGISRHHTVKVVRL